MDGIIIVTPKLLACSHRDSKIIIRLHFLPISFIFIKFLENKKSIAMSLKNVYISNFCGLKLCIKKKFINKIINII